MLVTGEFSNDVKTFITELNSTKQEDKDVCIQKFCDKMEEAVYKAIKKITITILSGQIQVVGSSTAQANAAPIALSNVVS